MKQLFQSLKTGKAVLTDMPVPSVRDGHLLIKSSNSLVSLGTERMIIEFGRASWFQKALQQPEKVKQVLKKVKTAGFQNTVTSVRNKLDTPIPVGYCNAGVVIDMGSDITSFKIGDRVISNGPHSEVVLVPERLCSQIPDSVDDPTACFTVLSSVALQGIRLADPTLGESVAVIGLGLLGLISCQILKANGCRVIGFDFDDNKIALAKNFGTESWNLNEIKTPVEAAMAFTGGNGVDAVLITASTKDNSPIEQAPQMCRKRGRVVLVGVVGLHLNRSDFYEKEISFQVSCSYGPGRYDHFYEQNGRDYPIGFVRWTEQRNFEAVLNLMADRKLVVDNLISNVIPFSEAGEIYNREITNRKNLGLILEYPKAITNNKRRIELKKTAASHKGTGSVKAGFIGAGGFTGSVLLPALVKTKASLIGISSAKGLSSSTLGKKYGFSFVTTDSRDIVNNPDINAVFITTQHDTHARFVVEGLEAGKHVFVEKPLAISKDQLEKIEDAFFKTKDKVLLVGFNRRFSPHAIEITKLLKGRQSPLSMTMTVNAGMVPASHWVQDPERGGGRIIGEACHFIDLMSFFTKSTVTSVYSCMVAESLDTICSDKISISLKFGDGSIGTINYFANGHKDIPKERMEIFSDGRILHLEDFKTLTGYGFNNFKRLKLRTQDKGHENEMSLFVDTVINGGAPIIPFNHLLNTTLATFAALESAKTGKSIAL